MARRQMAVEPENPDSGRRGAWALAMSVGWEVSSFTLIGVGAGWLCDAHFGSSPWGILVGTFVGIGLGLYSLIRTFGRAQNGGAGRR
jgi:F0F1-type ATP synthase assembly protein I